MCTFSNITFSKHFKEEILLLTTQEFQINIYEYIESFGSSLCNSIVPRYNLYSTVCIQKRIIPKKCFQRLLEPDKLAFNVSKYIWVTHVYSQTKLFCLK